MNRRPIMGLLAIGALALVLSALGGGGGAASAGRLPPCPETWPEATGFHDGWYVIIDRDTNGNKHGRAYPANAGYDVGYVPSAPWETCIVRIKDNPGVEQLDMSKDDEPSSNRQASSSRQPSSNQETPSNTPDHQPGRIESAIGQGGDGDPPPASPQRGAYSISAGATANAGTTANAQATTVEGQPATLTLTLSAAAPAGGAQFTVTPGYDGDATAEADDVGSIATPVTVPTGDTTLAITIPTVSDDVDEDVETFTVIVATTATGWVKTGDGGDTAVVTIVDNDTAGIKVTAARPLAVSEGATAIYTVILTSRPTADVTITAVSDDVGAATVRPASHTFSPSQWNQAKTFTVRGIADDDTNDERVVISHRVTSADGRYSVLAVSSVRVVVSDTTPPSQQGTSTDQQGSGGEPPHPTATPAPTPTRSSSSSSSGSGSGSGGSCPRDSQHEHDGDNHWHNWSINEADGQCHHYVGHSGIGYHEH